MKVLYNDDYISTPEAQAKYGYSLRHLSRLAKKRKIKGFKHANKWWIHEPSLKAYYAQKQLPL